VFKDVRTTVAVRERPRPIIFDPQLSPLGSGPPRVMGRRRVGTSSTPYSPLSPLVVLYLLSRNRTPFAPTRDIYGSGKGFTQDGTKGTMGPSLLPWALKRLHSLGRDNWLVRPGCVVFFWTQIASHCLFVSIDLRDSFCRGHIKYPPLGSFPSTLHVP